MSAISHTEFAFPGQTTVYHGKVRDVYTIYDKYMVSVATDRISAFDVILPKAIPHKGQVLNQIAAHFLEATKNIVPNWLISIPDPQVSIGHVCQPFKIEMVIRGCLVGHAWREYKAGKRELCGVPLPDGLKEYDRFPSPIITPATKAEEGHDEDISATDIVNRGLATQAQWDELVTSTQALFARGQQMAESRGLILADTKYEFGLLNGQLTLIDEIHTPDSSRYFLKDSYEAFVSGKTSEPPRHLSKEFVREWLLKNNFSGQDGQVVPEMTDEFVSEISRKYIELFELLTGQTFEAADETDTVKRIETNVVGALEGLDA